MYRGHDEGFPHEVPDVPQQVPEFPQQVPELPEQVPVRPAGFQPFGVAGFNAGAGPVVEEQEFRPDPLVNSLNSQLETHSPRYRGTMDLTDKDYYNNTVGLNQQKDPRNISVSQQKNDTPKT